MTTRGDRQNSLTVASMQYRLLLPLKEDPMTDLPPPIDPVPEPIAHGEDPKPYPPLPDAAQKTVGPPDKVALPIPVKPLERLPVVGGWLAGLLRKRLRPWDRD